METVALDPNLKEHTAARRAFTCGSKELDNYLVRDAGQQQRRDVARTRLLLNDTGRIIRGFYTLANYAVDAGELPEDVQRRYPRYPKLPAVLLARLAVAAGEQGRGLGRTLLMDAIYHIVLVANHSGAAFMIVDAKDDQAAIFYERFGFTRVPGQPLKLWLPMATLRRLDEQVRATLAPKSMTLK
jgi:GNAT superfamily N-acetyltransferase